MLNSTLGPREQIIQLVNVLYLSNPPLAFFYIYLSYIKEKEPYSYRPDITLHLACCMLTGLNVFIKEAIRATKSCCALA